MFRGTALGVLVFSAFVWGSVAFAGRLEQTTYYPAPDGQYSTLSSTEETHFAATSGNVGIGTTAPTNIVCTDTVNCDGATAASSADLTITGSIAQDPWVLVGSGGTAPNFVTTSGVTWVNFGAGHSTAAYFRDKNGIVHLRGVIKGGYVNRDASHQSLIFTLPNTCFPGNRELFIVWSAGAVGRCDVLTDGQVWAIAGENTDFSLDGITFRASGSGY